MASLTFALVSGFAISHTIETDFAVYRLGGAHLTSTSLYSARLTSTAGDPALAEVSPTAGGRARWLQSLVSHLCQGPNPGTPGRWAPKNAWTV